MDLDVNLVSKVWKREAEPKAGTRLNAFSRLTAWPTQFNKRVDMA